MTAIYIRNRRHDQCMFPSCGELSYSDRMAPEMKTDLSIHEVDTFQHTQIGSGKSKPKWYDRKMSKPPSQLEQYEEKDDEKDEQKGGDLAETRRIIEITKKRMADPRNQGEKQQTVLSDIMKKYVAKEKQEMEGGRMSGYLSNMIESAKVKPRHEPLAEDDEHLKKLLPSELMIYNLMK